METKKFVAFSCTHHPLQDNEAIDFLFRKISRFKPDVIVHLGDGHEANSASRWPNEYDWPLSLEFRCHNDFLKRIRKISPNSKKVFLPGNHESNLISINRIDKKLRDLCDYRDHEDELNYWEQPAEYIHSRTRGVWRLGQVTFAHGYEISAAADELQSIMFGVPYGLYVGGHSHKPIEVLQAHRTRAVPLPYWYCNAGTLGGLYPVWMDRRRSNQWGQAVVTGDAALTKGSRSSRMWNAEVDIFRMYDEE